MRCLTVYRKENGEFEALDLTPYSSPPDLPDVMKSQETNGQEQVGFFISRFLTQRDFLYNVFFCISFNDKIGCIRTYFFRLDVVKKNIFIKL